jgi:hypothetical protein
MVPEGVKLVPDAVAAEAGARDVSVGWIWSDLEPVAATPAKATPFIVGGSFDGDIPDEDWLSSAVFTNAVVAMLVSLSPTVGVGAVGFPVNSGLARGAFPANAESSPVIADVGCASETLRPPRALCESDVSALDQPPPARR